MSSASAMHNAAVPRPAGATTAPVFARKKVDREACGNRSVVKETHSGSEPLKEKARMGGHRWGMQHAVHATGMEKVAAGRCTGMSTKGGGKCAGPFGMEGVDEAGPRFGSFSRGTTLAPDSGPFL